jgi:ABC-2 type transport system permease protein
MLNSLMRLAVGLLPVILLANVFFGFNLFSLGVALGAFFAYLVFAGWAIGLVANGVVIRYGLGAESFTWVAVFFLLPISCVYYPLSTLPPWLQPIAASLPATHVFEGLRALLIEARFRGDLMLMAFGLNVLYLTGAYLIFRYFFWRARVSGALLQIGE